MSFYSQIARGYRSLPELADLPVQRGNQERISNIEEQLKKIIKEDRALYPHLQKELRYTPPDFLREFPTDLAKRAWGLEWMRIFEPEIRPRKKVSFFTPITYDETLKNEHGLKGRCVEFFDDFFFYFGKKARVTHVNKESAETEIIKAKAAPWYQIALKIIATATIIVPILMLIGKAIARSRIHYTYLGKVIERRMPSQEQDEKKL